MTFTAAGNKTQQGVDVPGRSVLKRNRVDSRRLQQVYILHNGDAVDVGESHLSVYGIAVQVQCKQSKFLGELHTIRKGSICGIHTTSAVQNLCKLENFSKEFRHPVHNRQLSSSDYFS